MGKSQHCHWCISGHCWVVYPQQSAGCGQVGLCSFSPQALLVIFLRGRGYKTMVFYSYRCPPTKFHCGSKAQFVDIWPWQVFKDQGQEFTEVVCDVLFVLCVTLCNQLCVSNCHIEARIWHPEGTPPASFGSRKTRRGCFFFMWSGKILFRKFVPNLPNIPGLKGGDDCWNSVSHQIVIININ